MESIYWLIPLSLVVLAFAIYLFFWAVKDGQFDDLDAEAARILFDDDEIKEVNHKVTRKKS